MVVSAAYESAEGEIFLSILRGLRIEVPAGEHPSSTAERLVNLHKELMLKAKQAGIVS
jgi:hypothetical protein